MISIKIISTRFHFTLILFAKVLEMIFYEILNKGYYNSCF